MRIYFKVIGSDIITLRDYRNLPPIKTINRSQTGLYIRRKNVKRNYNVCEYWIDTELYSSHTYNSYIDTLVKKAVEEAFIAKRDGIILKLVN